MQLFITVLHVFLCFFLILVVLLQPGKGADFGAAMGGASQDMMGAAGSVSLMSKLTAVVAALFMGTSLGLAWFSNAPEDSALGVDDIAAEAAETGGSSAPAEGTDAPEGVEPAPVEGTDEAPAAEGAEAAPAEGAEAAPAEGAEAAPAEGAEAAPAEGAAAAPAEDAEAAPAGDGAVE